MMFQRKEISLLFTMLFLNAAEILEKHGRKVMNNDDTGKILSKSIEELLQTFGDENFLHWNKVVRDAIFKKNNIWPLQEHLNEALSMFIEVTNYGLHKSNTKQFLRIIIQAVDHLNIELKETTKLQLFNATSTIHYLQLARNVPNPLNHHKWVSCMNKTITFLHDWIIWTEFLFEIHSLISRYEFQQNIDKYNVKNLSDWAESSNNEKGIDVTKDNFHLFLEKINASICKHYFYVISYPITEVKEQSLKVLFKQLFINNKSLHTECDASIGRILITGYFVTMSNVNKLRYKCQFPLHNVTIFAYHTLFIDADFVKSTNEETHLSIIAPRWIVILDDYKIVMSGLQGASLKQATTPDITGGNGTHGIQGLPGEPGGNIFILVDKFIGHRFVNVYAHGGKGGNGQRGGKGANGFDVNLNEYINNPSKLPLPKINKTNYNQDFNTSNKCFVYNDTHQRNHYYIIQDFSFGRGGDGGRGGQSGNKGEIKIVSLSDSQKFNIFNDDGQVGNGGKGGKAGWRVSFELVAIFKPEKVWEVIVNTVNYNEGILFSVHGVFNGSKLNNSKTPEKKAPFQNVSPTIELYKYGLRELLQNPFDGLYLQAVYKKLDTRRDILNNYTLMNFCSMFLNLEEQYDANQNQQQKMDFYLTFLNNLHKFKAQSNETLLYEILHATILSKIVRLKSYHNKELPYDFENYIDRILYLTQRVIKKKIGIIEMIKQLNEDYYETNKSYDLENIKEIYTSYAKVSLDQNLIELSESILTYRTLAKRQINTIEITHQMNKNIVLELIVLSLLEKIDYFTNFMIMVTKELDVRQKQLDWNQNKQTKELVDLVTEAFFKLFEEKQGEINKNIENFYQEVQYLLNSAQNHQLEQYLEKIKNEMKKPKVDVETISKIMNQLLNYMNKLKINLQNIDFNKKLIFFRNCLAMINHFTIDLYRKYKNNPDIMTFFAELIKEVEEDISEIRSNRQSIFVVMISILNIFRVKFTQNITDPEIIDISLWDTSRKLKNIMQLLSQFCVGIIDNYIGNKMPPKFAKFNLVLSKLMSLYDYLDYKSFENMLILGVDQTAAKLSHISNTSQHIFDMSHKLYSLIEYNMVSHILEKLIQQMQQWIFPFAPFYRFRFETPPQKFVDKNCVIIVQFFKNIKDLKDKVEIYRTTFTTGNNKNTQVGNFSTYDPINKPFFIWKRENYGDEFKQLTAGKTIMLTAFLKAQPDLFKSNIKLKTVQLKFRTYELDYQEELNERLRSFELNLEHMGNSYYKCDKWDYIIRTQMHKSIISYEFSDSNEPISRNSMHKMLENSQTVVSPYTSWKITLKQINNRYSFQDLKRYENDFDLLLVGNGFYTFDPELCANINRYYFDNKIKDIVTSTNEIEPILF